MFPLGSVWKVIIIRKFSFSNCFPGQDNSEAVERIEISFTDAQKQFVRNEEARDKKDELFQNRSFNFGYFPRSEYEIVNERSLETPTQRYISISQRKCWKLCEKIWEDFSVLIDLD